MYLFWWLQRVGLVQQLPSYEIESMTEVRILEEAICISLRANALGKDMSSTPSYG